MIINHKLKNIISQTNNKFNPSLTMLIEKELDQLKTKVKPFCSHPSKVDSRFNVCAIYGDLMIK